MKKTVITLLIVMATLLFAGSVIGAQVPVQQNNIHSSSPTGNLVEITAEHLKLEGPDEIPSGWTTFRLHNADDHTHFAVVEKFPEGYGVEDHQAIIAPIFQEGMDLLNAGLFAEAFAKFGELPAWFNEIVFMGGPGLIAPGETAQTTVYLEPGTYVLECYVKTNGIFHAYNPDPNEFGMVHEITVTDEVANASEPKPTTELTISSTDGIEISGNLRPGKNVISVYFEDQTVHGNFLEHDVQLVRLEEDDSLEELETWINWVMPTGLETPAPFEFMGGLQEMPAGSTGYFTVLLTPGRYAFVSEVDNAISKGMLVEFTVP